MVALSWYVRHERVCWPSCHHTQHASQLSLHTACLTSSSHWQGILRGYDQATNLILDECHERVFSTKVRLSRAVLFTQPANSPLVVVCVTARPNVGMVSCNTNAALRRGHSLCSQCVPKEALTRRHANPQSCHPANDDLPPLLQSGVEQLVLGLYMIRGDNV